MSVGWAARASRRRGCACVVEGALPRSLERGERGSSRRDLGDERLLRRTSVICDSADCEAVATRGEPTRDEVVLMLPVLVLPVGVGRLVFNPLGLPAVDDELDGVDLYHRQARGGHPSDP